MGLMPVPGLVSCRIAGQQVAGLPGCWVARPFGSPVARTARPRSPRSPTESASIRVVSSSSPLGRLADGVELPVAQVELLHFGEGHGACTDAVEDRDLVAALVGGTVAVEAFGDGHGRAARFAVGDEPRHGA